MAWPARPTRELDTGESSSVDDPRPIVFDAGEGWDGTCTAQATPIPAEAFASVTYRPPTLETCMPSPAPKPPPITASFARACAGTGEERPERFANRMESSEGEPCRRGYERRIELTEQLHDQRSCTPCECGVPEGGHCAADVFLYGDSSCGTQIEAALTVGQGDALCADISSPLPLAAMRATMTEAEAGRCAPSVSTLVGTIERGTTRVLCCVE